MNKLMLSVFLGCMLFCMGFIKHPIHLSITEIDFKNDEIQIAHKVFIDDLEKALRKKHATLKFNLATETQLANVDKYIFEYMQGQFKINVNDNEKTISYIGLEYEENTVWIYGLVKNHTTITQKEKVSIRNAVLTTLYEDQRNMTYLSKGETKEFLNFEMGKLFQSVNF